MVGYLGAEISLRTSDRGGSLQPTGPRAPLGFSGVRERVILLVHGYNVPEHQALASLRGMQFNLRRLAPLLALDTCRVYWPGDWAFPSPFRGLAYPLIVPQARRAGPELARAVEYFKTKSGGEPEVIIVAHSLGCRVALEALKVLPLARKRLSLILMAAAVPVEYVRDGMRLHMATARARESLVLFSPDDRVLSSAFGFGQMLSPGESGKLSEAVGLHGRPHTGVWTQRYHMAGFGHGSYWASEAAARVIAGTLGAAVTRQPPTRTPPFKRPILPRELPSTARR